MLGLQDGGESIEPGSLVSAVGSDLHESYDPAAS